MKTREEDQNKNIKSEKSINGMSHNNVHKKRNKMHNNSRRKRRDENIQIILQL